MPKYRIVSDLEVPDEVAEQYIVMVAAQHALQIKWALQTQYPEASVELNHHGIRRIDAD